MAIDDYVMEIEGAAEQVALEARAVYRCPAHPHFTISTGDCDAERHAYTLLTHMWKCEDCDDDRNFWLESLKDYLGQAAYNCPECKVDA